MSEGESSNLEQHLKGSQPTGHDFTRETFQRFLEQEKKAMQQLAEYTKEHKAPTAQEILKPFIGYKITNITPESIHIPDAYKILRSVNLSSLNPFSRYETPMPLTNLLKHGYQFGERSLLTQLEGAFARAAFEKSKKDQETSYRAPVGEKSLLTQLKEAFASARAVFEKPKKDQETSHRAPDKPAPKIFYGDIQKHPGDTIEDIESKIDKNVKLAEELLKEFDKEFEVLREKPENKSMFSSLAQHETTRKEKKTRLQLREIQIGYQVVSKIIDELKSNPEYDITSHDIERTRRFYWDYARYSGEIRGWQINRRESGKKHDEQRAMDIFRNVYLSDYKAWLRARHLVHDASEIIRSLGLD